MPFKAVIEIDNVDDYLKVNERVKIEQPPKKEKKRKCPFCGSEDLELMVHSMTPHFYNLKQQIDMESQQRDLHCKSCDLIHHIHKSEIE